MRRFFLESHFGIGYNGAGDLTETMDRTLRTAVLTACLGGLAASAVCAQPLLLSPLLSQPPTYAQAFSLHSASWLLSSRPPAAAAPAPLAFSGTPFAGSAVFTLPTVSRWQAAYRSDPSLRLTDWKRVFNICRLGVFEIPLRSDPAERANILLSAQAVDSATVAPGGIFSFNETVGERTPERGYQDGLMFNDGQIVRGTGGGICLVSTGLYNAALQAGLGLVERHPHSGVVGYAPPGCDAGVVYGSEDMRFRNTTGAPIVIKTNVQDDRVVVGLFGRTPTPGRKVFVKETHLAYIHAPLVETPDPTLPAGAAPVVVQKPRLGFDVTVERFFTQGTRVVRRELVVTEHRNPRAKIVHVPLPAASPPNPMLPAGLSAPGDGPPPPFHFSAAEAGNDEADQ